MAIQPVGHVFHGAHQHQEKITPPPDASAGLPLLHIMIDTMKKFLNGLFNGVSLEYLQEYLDEICYRLNRRFRETELPLRLLDACLTYALIIIAENY